MNPLLIGPLADLIKAAIGRIFPDPAQAAEANLKLATLVQTGQLAQLAADTDLAKAQIGVDNTEAGSDSLFKSGWRPWIGWTCGVAFGWNYIGGPALTWATGAAAAAGYLPHAVAFVPVDMSQMMPVLFGMLGLGAYRTVEKIKGAA